MLVSLISYIDRNTLALLIPTIMRDTHLSAEQYGFIVSAFSIAYMIGSPIWGGLLDRLGLRVGMTLAVAFWTAASVSHAMAAGFLSFAAARTALGFGEGATFPGGLRTVVSTLPPGQQARGIGFAYSGGALGAIITPIVVTPIFAVWGWRPAFLFTGGIGAAWLIMWFFVSARPPIRERMAEALRHTEQGPRFTDARLWSFILAYGLGATPLGFVMYAAALYLNQALGKDQIFLGKVLWIPPLGWELGYFFWGWLVDRMTSAGVPKLTTVRRLMFASLFLSLPLAAVPYMSSTALVLLEMFIATFVIVGFVVPSLAYATHVYSPSRSGLIAGIGAGSYGAIVAVTMPLFGRLFDVRRYDVAFAIAALLPAIGYAGWAWINRNAREPRRIVVKQSLAGLLLAAAVAWTFGPRVAAQSSSDPRVQAHIDAAKAAAGSDFAYVFNRICREAVPPENPEPRPQRGARPPGPPARETWHAEPVKVFDNLYFLGQTEYSAWAVTTSAGIIIIDSIFDYSVDDEVAGGLKAMGLDPANIKYVIISHGHSDHSGGAKYLQDRFNAKVILTAADWDLLDRSNGTKPHRDMIATDGQKLTLGHTTLTLYNTPGHTLGTISTLIPVTDRGQKHVAAYWGGTAFNWMAGPAAYITPERPPIFWFKTYSDSARRFKEITAKAGADIILSNHTDFDGSKTKLPALAQRKAGDPNPYVIGAANVQRYLTTVDECAQAGLTRAQAMK